MRARFIIVISIVLMVVFILGSIYQSFAIRKLRLQNIDNQMRSTAVALIDSKILNNRNIDIDLVDEIISKELGVDSIGKFFVVRDEHNSVIYSSIDEHIFDLKSFNSASQWETFKQKNKFVRLLTLKLPSFPDRSLQIGFILAKDLETFSLPEKKEILSYFSIVTVTGLLLSLLLSSYLFRPIRLLRTLLKEQNQNYKIPLATLPEQDLATQLYFKSKNDDFLVLVQTYNELIDRINSSYEISRRWSYHFAHELKHPLTMVIIEIEQIKKNAQINSVLIPNIENIKSQVFSISKLISSFLNWAELENIGVYKQGIFLLDISKEISDIIRKVKTDLSCKIEVHDIDNSFEFIGNRELFTELLTNIIGNAVIHNSSEVIIDIHIKNHLLKIIDNGKGIPPNVIKNIGMPFNKSPKSKGHGLGLAWIYTICKIHAWSIDVDTNSHGTAYIIAFPHVEEDYSLDEVIS